MRGAPAPPAAPCRLRGSSPQNAPAVCRCRGNSPSFTMAGFLAVVYTVSLVLVGAQSDIIFRVPEVLVRHAAASRPVGTGSTPLNASRSNEAGSPERDKDGMLELGYEEYFVEHEVSAADARKAAAALNLDDVAPPAGCGQCSRRERDYCETRVVADHCCCERRFLPEPLPWLPHTCYVGPGRCHPRARDCARYARLRDCCCRAVLAARWKSILSGSPRAALGAAALLPLLLLAL